MSEIPPVGAALGRIPSGLFIITARHGRQQTGMLASWVQQCSFQPPRISLAVQPERALAGFLTPDAPFVVNILATGSADLLKHFGKGFAPEDDAFAGLAIERTPEQVPILRDALAWLDCRVVRRVSAAGGDHELVIGQVLAGQVLTEGSPTVHIRRNGLRY